MRHFERPIFFGGPGVKDQVKKLHDQVDHVLDLMSGMQQPPHCRNEQEVKEEEMFREKINKEMYETICNIVLAMGYYIFDMDRYYDS